MRKITPSAAFLSFAILLLGALMSGQAAADDVHVVKVACSTYDGRVVGADTTSRPDEVPLVCGPCSLGNQCVECLGALIENGCEFDQDLKARYLAGTGPNQCDARPGEGAGTAECLPGSAVLYQLFDNDGDCIADTCEEAM